MNDAGDISRHKSRVFISEVFRGEDIGLEKVDDNFYRIYFCNLEVGEFDISDLRFSTGSSLVNDTEGMDGPETAAILSGISGASTSRNVTYQE